MIGCTKAVLKQSETQPAREESPVDSGKQPRGGYIDDIAKKCGETSRALGAFEMNN